MNLRALHVPSARIRCDHVSTALYIFLIAQTNPAIFIPQSDQAMFSRLRHPACTVYVPNLESILTPAGLELQSLTLFSPCDTLYHVWNDVWQNMPSQCPARAPNLCYPVQCTTSAVQFELCGRLICKTHDFDHNGSGQGILRNERYILATVV